MLLLGFNSQTLRGEKGERSLVLSCKIVQRLKGEASNVDTGWFNTRREAKGRFQFRNYKQCDFWLYWWEINLIVFFILCFLSYQPFVLQQNKRHLLLISLYFFSKYPIFMRIMHHSDWTAGHLYCFLLMKKEASLTSWDYLGCFCLLQS